MHTLSKSDFKIASNCAKKLQYKKEKYPSALEGNDFMEMLAEGGYIVGKLATILYSGIEINGNTEEAVALTELLLQKENITLHEAAIQSGQKIIRIDILEKKGNVFNLIEVKAKSFNSTKEHIDEETGMEEYIEDVVFQTQVLQEAYPDAIINSFLLMPDKSRQTEIEGLASWFKIIQAAEVSKPGAFRKIEVEFIEEEGTEEYVIKRQLLLQDGLLQLLTLNNKVAELSSVIHNRSEKFLRILNSGFEFQPGDYEINKECKSCEFRASKDNTKDGFNECFGDMGQVAPNIFELFMGGKIKTAEKVIYFNELINKQKFSLYDIDLEELKTKKGEYGVTGLRQLIQIDYTKKNIEWISDNMKSELSMWQYPLHFIDFETYSGAIPYHKDMRPYEAIAFQWSCHTINSQGEEPVHSEWINTEKSFPNFRFAESLMKQIGYSGTPLMWSTHENTTLRRILIQMDEFRYENEILKSWLINITKDEGREGRLIDMNAFTLRNYFHPYMKGRTSIKKVLPAVWNYHSFLHQIPWFKKYYKLDADGNISDPYQTLKYIFDAGSIEDALAKKELEDTVKEVVKEGGAAMKAYNDMMYGEERNKEKLKNQLLEYCKLDTMAMVIIWTYWNSL